MKISVFLSENFQFLELKFSIYLDRRVFGMARLIQKAGHFQLFSLLSRVIRYRIYLFCVMASDPLHANRGGQFCLPT